MKKGRVLVTGASGFIGSNCLEYWLDHTELDFTCICAWEHKGTPKNLQFIKDNPRVKIFTHDLTATIPDLGRFDYIINLASLSHVDTSISDPVNFINNNVKLTLNTLEYARKYKPEVFIQFSTDEVYGARDHKSWDVLLPSNPYAASKAAQEMIALSYWRTYDVPIVITNSNNIVGKNQDPEKFVPKIIELIKQDKVVTLHFSNGKPGVRYYNAVDNVADVLMYIMSSVPPVKYSTKNKYPNKYNLGGGERLDNLEMAQLVARILDKPLKMEVVDAETVRKGYDEFYAQTTDNIISPFVRPWEPVITLEESMKKWIN